MRKSEPEIRAQRQPWTNSIELMAFVSERGATFVAKPLEYEAIEDGSLTMEPTARLSNQAAQLLIDELWRCGLRPSEGSGSAGSLAATERHLQDMQSVAFGLLRKDGVQID